MKLKQIVFVVLFSLVVLPVKAATTSTPFALTVSASDLSSLGNDELRRLQEAAEIISVSFPSRDNAQAFMAIQKVILDRAEKLAINSNGSR